MRSSAVAVNLVWLVVMTTSSFSPGEMQGCPIRSLTVPCSCQEKSRGLDVSCENANLQDLRQAFEHIGQTKQQVWYLKLRNSQLPTFPDDLLGELRVSHFIALNSGISSIDDSAFSGVVDDLESLDFTRNALERVPTAALEQLVNLASLNLNFNSIKTLHAEAFRGLISLLRLSLFGNRLKFIDNLAFVGVGGNLTQVNLGDNHLTSVPSQPLRNLTVLQKLQVQENRITAIFPEEFQGMGESVDTLELAGNQIEELPERTFVNLRMLSSLDLENNQIRLIHPRAFEGIETSLEWLKLGGNKLDSIPAYALRNLDRLRQLDLRQNVISKVSEDDFKNYGHNLKFVYLQKNNLDTIETSAFAEMDSLEWLYLQSNQLTAAPYETFGSILDTVQVLDLHDNPFHCDCRISWFRDWIHGQGSKTMNMPRETKCATPENFRRVAIADVDSEELSCTMSGSAGTSPHVILMASSFMTLNFFMRPHMM